MFRSTWLGPKKANAPTIVPLSSGEELSAKMSDVGHTGHHGNPQALSTERPFHDPLKVSVLRQFVVPVA